MSRELIVIGAGGGSRELIGFLPEINAALPARSRWDVRGVLDDDDALAGERVAGVPVVGPLASLAEYASAWVVIGIAGSRDVSIRRRILERLAVPADRLATLIHPRAYVSYNATVGPGCVVYPHVAVGPDAVLGGNSVVYFNTVIHHDSVVGRHSMLCAGVHVAGGVTMGACVYAGIACTVRDGVRIGAGSLIGMGAVVTRDVADGQTVCGVPAREHVPAAQVVLS